ncbi:Uncharacterised protein [Mycobacteroides abscessus subsp. abscessus]|nr:Uncharacterised protein [Mycobacteroides abscessus subsp. abscessus]
MLGVGLAGLTRLTDRPPVPAATVMRSTSTRYAVDTRCRCASTRCTTVRAVYGVPVRIMSPAAITCERVGLGAACR